MAEAAYKDDMHGHSKNTDYQGGLLTISMQSCFDQIPK